MFRKKHVKYIAYLIIILVFLTFYNNIYGKFLIEEEKSPFIPVFSIEFFITLIFDVLLGAFFGLERFISNLKSLGKWKINLTKLLIIGIPTAFLSVTYFNFLIINTLNLYYMQLLSPSREAFFRLLLGYTIISSFYKKDEM